MPQRRSLSDDAASIRQYTGCAFGWVARDPSLKPQAPRRRAQTGDSAAVNRRTSESVGSCAVWVGLGELGALDAEFLDLARNGVAAYAKQLRGFDPPSSGCRQGPSDQGSFE